MTFFASHTENLPIPVNPKEIDALSLLFRQATDAEIAQEHQEFLPSLLWVLFFFEEVAPFSLYLSESTRIQHTKIQDSLHQSILDRRCTLLPREAMTEADVLWLDARDLGAWDAAIHRKTDAILILTGDTQTSRRLVQRHASTFVVAHDLAILALGPTPPEPFLTLCHRDDQAAQTRRTAIRTLIHRSIQLRRDAAAHRHVTHLHATNFARSHELAADLRACEQALHTAHADLAAERRQIAVRLAHDAVQQQTIATLQAWYKDVQKAEVAQRAAWTAFIEQYRLFQDGILQVRSVLLGPTSRIRRAWRSLRAAPPAFPVAPTPSVLPALPLPALQVPIAAPPIAPTEPSPQPHHTHTPCASRRCILFIAGEPETPGIAYRCHRVADAAATAGYETRVRPCADISVEDMRWADFAVLWRVEFSGHVDILLGLAAEYGTTTIFDADDIVFQPQLARIDIIDGIRSIGATEERMERYFSEMRRTLQRCDLGFTTTEELALAMRVEKPLVHVVPNSFDLPSLLLARHARRSRVPHDPTIRIIYATGSRTHQRDMAQIVPSLVEVLRARPNVRLVLFRDGRSDTPVVLVDEFPALQSVAAQIEWRDMVPLEQLPTEYARVEIAIAPLEIGNVFCEAKSEIKMLEAALANIPTIASATGPYRRLIRDGETGFVAANAAEWHNALLALIDQPALRRRMGRDAHHDILGCRGPWAQAQCMRLFLDGLQDDVSAASTGAHLLARAHAPRRALPDIPASDTLFSHDAGEQADVTVLITCYNYADLIFDALESVAAQTVTELDLIVVDDGSTDGSLERVTRWLELHHRRFNRACLLRSCQNVGLGGARNIGMDAAETLYVMQLDADNRLLPEACARLLQETTIETAYVYPVLQAFDEHGVQSAEQAEASRAPTRSLRFHPLNMIGGNHVDAMALIAKWAWAMAGGYYVARDAMGWEDYDLWCSFAELGLVGHHCPETLAQYRIHTGSMTNAVTERAAHKARVVALVQQRHPWIRLVTADARLRIIQHDANMA